MQSRSAKWDGSSSTSVRLADVRRWARLHNVGATDFASLHRKALLVCISRLVQGICREALCSVAFTSTAVVLGEGRLVAPASRRPFGRLEVTGLPELPGATPARRTASGGAFLHAVGRIVPGWDASPMRERLRADFHNSLASLLLNHLMVQLRKPELPASEPVYQGHHVYPFPALRNGPSLDDIVACSNLTAAPVHLAVIELGQLTQISQGGLDVYPAALGVPNSDHAALLPVHPWHLATSPVLRHLLAAGQARMLDLTIEAIPLASQRTCRILATGHDVKLPIDADITGERRLLFRLNCENATAVSSLIARIAEQDDMGGYFAGQYDIASIFHPLDNLSPSLAAIVRMPARDARVQCHAAINLWSGRCDARQLVPQDARGAERFFAHYCRALLRGPLHLLLRRGIATEPHLQNSIMCMDGGFPVRLMLRDLDASVFDRGQWETSSAHNLNPVTWMHMPAFGEGARRTIHALFYGHLGCVVDFMAQARGVREARLLGMIDETWADLVAIIAQSGQHVAHAAQLYGDRQAVRVCLASRLQRDPRLYFSDPASGRS